MKRNYCIKRELLLDNEITLFAFSNIICLYTTKFKLTRQNNMIKKLSLEYILDLHQIEYIHLNIYNIIS